VSTLIACKNVAAAQALV